MDPLDTIIDVSIRRALGFAGLAIGVVMLALSFDLPLALRSGADLVAVVSVALLFVAWRTPQRDMRHSEPWRMLNDMLPELARAVSKAELQRRLKEALRRRLVWHAERVGLIALGLWTLTVLALALRAR